MVGVPNQKQRSLLSKYPEVINIVDTFISQHGSEAHRRRQDSTKYANGVTLQEIADKVVKEIPNLKSVSRTTILRLLEPPNKGHVNAKRYKSCVLARVPPKRNDHYNQKLNLHYCRAQVYQTLEAANMFSSEAVTASFDNKDKFNVGTLMISRHQKIQKFFKTNDAPIYEDHDFPFSNSKLTPYGYIHLLPKPRRSQSLDRQNSKSRLHRSRSLSPPKKSIRYIYGQKR